MVAPRRDGSNLRQNPTVSPQVLCSISAVFLRFPEDPMLVGSIPGTRADFGEVGDLLDGNC